MVCLILFGGLVFFELLRAGECLNEGGAYVIPGLCGTPSQLHNSAIYNSSRVTSISTQPTQLFISLLLETSHEASSPYESKDT